MPVENLNEIKDDFDKVIRYSQNIPEPKTDELFEKWLKCKERFIDFFGGKLIYEYPEKVQFELGKKEKHDRVIRFAGQISSLWGYHDLAKFIEAQEEGFFQNLTIEDYTAWDGKVIRKGSKLVKSFRHFVNNDRCLADIQNEASRIIQENKIEGTLCLSVHPLDFLSLSENTYNWRSCHSLDGEYRAGNLSYMLDETTFICYLKGADEVRLNNFGPEVPWNSKKWRVLLFLSNDKKMIIAGRQYPFESKIGMDIVLNDLLKKIKIWSVFDYKWSDWNDFLMSSVKLSNGLDIELNEDYLVIGNELLPISDVVIDGVGAKNYNDVLNSSCYKPIYTFVYSDLFGHLYTTKNTKFVIGGYTYCLRCGRVECLTGEDTMLCIDCELEYGNSESDLFTICDCCGQRMYVDDGYSVGYDILCENCYREETITCEICGENCYSEYMRYNEKEDQYICQDCFIEMGEC